MDQDLVWPNGNFTRAEAMCDLYTRLLEYNRRHVAAVLAAMAQARPGGILFHCYAGKDRTGIIAALLLSLAGVPDELIAEDYAVSLPSIEARRLTLLADPSLTPEKREYLDVVYLCPGRHHAPDPGLSAPPVRRGGRVSAHHLIFPAGPGPPARAPAGMSAVLTNKERLMRQARGQEVDRVPSLGGWIGGARVLAQLAGISEAAYLADPQRGVIQASVALQVDGLVQPAIFTHLEQIRTGLVQEASFAGIEPEALLACAAAYPDTEREVLAAFDPAAEEQRYRDYFAHAAAHWQGLVPLPNFWEIGGHFPLYTEFGYNAFWMACALYPEALGKIYWAKSLHSRERAKILARLYRELELVPLMFCGEDVCNNSGPMVSPAFLRRYYFPTVAMIIEPLVDAGVRLIHHCDGDVRAVLDDFIEMGFSGLQGFQYELGIDLYELNHRRSRLGEELLFFTGLSVSRTLPFGSPEDVRAEVDYFLDATGGGRGMFLFTSNVSGVEVPPENIREAYHYIKTWDPRASRRPAHSAWPWAEKHPS